uniref:PPM-type phosphatase domain-containing protein n=1 Tax=Chromera velia CCMP2878 TaxID=1169474 RepID=A0A0G4FNN5_9ALVE|eukprot:Cvel_17958.t1-p1 / transcript=Cvel_17958.t1 / gene=Cvel_17958 / organism=Chromera_velia_CCMP2878 / gene_product=Probable protein phosphatase 2C 41, putative / transcript_product=Probable protein phosphatase 2C 41, putative / location=Cvel_scaffold1461:3970-14092(+) / protein_length=661 / sequence_SO=supercontig / SO=protein_coding / is_pseudo=false
MGSSISISEALGYNEAERAERLRRRRSRSVPPSWRQQKQKQTAEEEDEKGVCRGSAKLDRVLGMDSETREGAEKGQFNLVRSISLKFDAKELRQSERQALLQQHIPQRIRYDWDPSLTLSPAGVLLFGAVKRDEKPFADKEVRILGVPSLEDAFAPPPSSVFPLSPHLLARRRHSLMWNDKSPQAGGGAAGGGPADFGVLPGDRGGVVPRREMALPRQGSAPSRVFQQAGLVSPECSPLSRPSGPRPASTNAPSSVHASAPLRSDHEREPGTGLDKSQQGHPRGRKKGAVNVRVNSFASSWMEAVGAAVVSRRGLKHDPPLPTDPPNQDNFFVAQCEEGGATLCGVLDGHGDYGHFVSLRLAQSLPHFIMTSSYWKGRADGEEKDLKRALRNAFELAQTDLKLFSILHGVDIACSGSTAVVAVRRGPDLFVAHVGDSKAVLALPAGSALVSPTPPEPLTEEEKEKEAKKTDEERKEEAKRLTEEIARSKGMQVHYNPKQDMTYIEVTTDHNGLLEEEARRIEASGGRIKRTKSSCRVCISEEDGGLAMTRALGDLESATVGVLHKPSVAQLRLKEDSGAFLTLGSDGIWDVMGIEETLGVTEKKIKARGANCAMDWIVTESWRRWKEQMAVTDDLTALSLQFASNSAKRSANVVKAAHLLQ